MSHSVVLPLKRQLTGTIASNVAVVDFVGALLKVPGYSIGLFNIVCSGLGTAGTFDIALLCADGTWRTVSTGTTEAQIATISDQYIHDGIRVTMNTGTGATAPVAYLSALGHNQKHTIYQ